MVGGQGNVMKLGTGGNTVRNGNGNTNRGGPGNTMRANRDDD
jgi:hypothetical protein